MADSTLKRFFLISNSNKTKFHINDLHKKKPSKTTKLNLKLTHKSFPFKTKDILRSFVIGLEVVKTKPAAKNYLLCSTND